MFHGSIPALVTPFKNGAVDKKAFANLVERQIAGGSAALVPVGTTGETSTLSTEEHKEVVSLVITSYSIHYTKLYDTIKIKIRNIPIFMFILRVILT